MGTFVKKYLLFISNLKNNPLGLSTIKELSLISNLCATENGIYNYTVSGIVSRTGDLHTAIRN